MTKTTFTVTLDKENIVLTLKSGATATIIPANNDKFPLEKGQIFLLTKKSQINLIASEKSLIPKLEFDKVIVIDPSAYDLDIAYLVQYLVQTAQEEKIKLAAVPDSIKIPKNIFNASAKAMDEIFTVLSPFGIQLKKKKFVSPKAQHRWKKAFSEIEFHIEHKGTSGTVIWEKSTQMRLLKGAQMLPDDAVSRRADGSVGFSGKFALNLRKDHEKSYDKKTYQTTEDILLRSVNEIGHFLYFAGTNSWLEMFDKDGRSIHEISVVK
ncbi:MAG: hypothetical protein FWF42_00780 [Streptococcaceae bacterium]|nr:hypothetical protein [Streptococcaceae bacterium]MCL2681591.1 hypothetical protein [Streptococcaceae bacterium]MCL2858203.1 hypothetical protein [Streptococcaceae bacterium]